MSRSERATVLRINSVGAVGAQVAPGRVVFEHRAEDHEQRAHAGGERANTRVGQAASTDGRGYRARDAGGAQSASIPKSARSTISTTSAIPILPPFCAPSVIPAEAGIHATAQPCDTSFRHSHPSAIPAPPPSFLRRQESTRPPNRATSLHPPFPSFRIPILPAFLRPLRHSCAPSVIPAEAGIHATAQPCDEPPSAIPILPPFLRPLRHSCGGRNPCDRPTVRRASIRHSHPSAIPAPPPSFLRPLRHSCGGRNPRDRPTVRRASIRHSHPSAIPAPPPSFLRPLRHSCGGRNPRDRPTVRRASIRHSHPSAIPAPPPSFLRPLRHSCGGRNPCDRPTVRRASIRHSHPSAIPAPPPSFLRPLRHSCGGRNPRDRPTVRRASIRPTAHQSPQRAAGDRAPSNIGSALDPTDRMDSCLRRNDGQAGVTEGRV